MARKSNSQISGKKPEEAEPDDALVKIDLDKLAKPFLSASNKKVVTGHSDVMVPVVLLHVLGGSSTHSRATKVAHVNKHAQLFTSGKFDQNKSLLYVIDTQDSMSFQELAARHPHAVGLMKDYLQTPFGKQNGMRKLSVLDGQHRVRGWEQAITADWDVVSADTALGSVSQNYWIEVNVRVLKQETPPHILVRKMQAPFLKDPDICARPLQCVVYPL
jgi:hypothetical protein